MTDETPAQMHAAEASSEHEPSLAEISARRTAAHSQWEKALARAKERFNPVNVRNEVVDTAANAIGEAADTAGSFAWAHRGKLAVAGLLGGLFFARKPIAKAAAPLTGQAKVSLDKATQAIRERTRR